MPRHSADRLLIVILLLMPLLGCAAEPAVEEEAPPTAAAESEALAADSLTPPFTADQIRDEWAPGLTIVFHFNFPDRQEWQRWTVVEADSEGAVIEYLPLDSQGKPTGEPQRAPSGWGELRDHALFPAADARRERVSRKTALGELEGWLYRVRDPLTEVASEFFFADELPGAPVWMESRSGETAMLTLNQIARQRLGGAPAAGPETAPAPG